MFWSLRLEVLVWKRLIFFHDFTLCYLFCNLVHFEKYIKNLIGYNTVLWPLISHISAGGLPCNLEGIIESPIVNGYRNKCEFSVGYSMEGKATVGFSLGNFRYAALSLFV